MALFRRVQVFQSLSTTTTLNNSVTGIAGALLPDKMKTHIVKPIFGKKIEDVFNGISKDEEDWFATAFSDRWEIYVTHHGTVNRLFINIKTEV